MSYKKVLYIGGQKSGKTALALHHTKKLAKTSTPIYIATYKNDFYDKAMQKKINNHKKERKNIFTTIEQPKNINKVIKDNNTYIIDCLSMWIFNNIDKEKQYFIKHLKKIVQKKANIVFVLNDVNTGIIPINKMSRKFVDISGIVGQFLTQYCNKVYDVKYGIRLKLK